MGGADGAGQAHRVQQSLTQGWAAAGRGDLHPSDLTSTAAVSCWETAAVFLCVMNYNGKCNQCALFSGYSVREEKGGVAMEDEQIVALFWRRDQEAIVQSQRKYHPYLSKIAYNILHDQEGSWRSAVPPGRTRSRCWMGNCWLRPSAGSSAP